MNKKILIFLLIIVATSAVIPLYITEGFENLALIMIVPLILTLFLSKKRIITGAIVGIISWIIEIGIIVSKEPTAMIGALFWFIPVIIVLVFFSYLSNKYWNTN